MSFLKRPQKHNSRGFSHHFILPVIAILAVGGIGAYLTFASKAATGVTSGRMAYNYADGNNSIKALTINSSGGDEALLPAGKDSLIYDVSYGGKWVLARVNGEFRVYSSDLKRSYGYGVKSEFTQECGDGTTENFIVYHPVLISNNNPDVVPEMVYVIQPKRCSDYVTLSNKIVAANIDGSKKTLHYDPEVGAIYRVQAAGTNKVTFLLRYPRSGGMPQSYSLTYYGTLRPIPYTLLAPKSNIVSRDGSKYISKNNSTNKYDVMSYTGKVLKSSVYTVVYGEDVFAASNDMTKLAIVKEDTVKQTEYLYIYDTVTKKRTAIDSGVKQPYGNGGMDVFLFINLKFSSSGGFLSYTKRDNKYRTYSIRRVNVNSRELIVTKSFPYQDAPKGSINLYW